MTGDRRRLERVQRDIDEIRHVAFHASQGFHNLSHELGAMRDGLATLANVGDSVVALSRRLARERDADLDEIDELRRSVDQLRLDIRRLAERAGLELTTPSYEAPALVNRATPRGEMFGVSRVHLGEAGNDPDVVRLDDRDDDGVDHVVRLHRLPVRAGSLDELSIAHVIERYTERRLRDEVLPTWLDLLAPGGRLRIVALDGAGMLSAWHDGTLSFDDVRHMIAPPSADEPLRSTFDADRLSSLLQASGFVDVTVVETNRRSSHRIEMQLVARRDNAS